MGGDGAIRRAARTNTEYVFYLYQKPSFALIKVGKRRWRSVCSLRTDSAIDSLIWNA